MYFTSEEHQNLFKKYVAQNHVEDDVYRKVFFYIMTSDMLSSRINDCYDFTERCIKPESLDAPWQTSSSCIPTVQNPSL